MIARNVSLVSALTLVGVGLLVNALASLGGTELGSAFAGNGRSLSESTRSYGVEERNRPDRGVAPRASRALMASGSGCVEADPLDWFGPIRPLEMCGVVWGLPTQDGSAADVNGDGKLEYFGYLESTLISEAGVPLPNRPLIHRVEVAYDGAASLVRLASILETQPLAEWILADQGWTESIWCGWGWIDIDGDGDLDLQISFNSVDPQTWEPLRRLAWLENTGFEATPPLTGDLNSDGHVNSTDLALLLGGWTGG